MKRERKIEILEMIKKLSDEEKNFVIDFIEKQKKFKKNKNLNTIFKNNNGFSADLGRSFFSVD